MKEFEKKIDLIAKVHNEVRNALYPEQSDEAHYINENTISRIAALMENRFTLPSYKCTFKSGEEAIRTVRYLRNQVLHAAGRFEKNIRKGVADWQAIQEFSKICPAITPKDYDKKWTPICVAGKEVLQPLVDGIKIWAKNNS